MANINNVIGALCTKAEWSLSNLEIQKGLYLAQLLYLGQYDEPLFHDDFQAWDYGPVQPNVYHDLKMFGSSAVKPLSYISNPKLSDQRADDVVGEVADLAVKSTAGRLVRITHWDHGAWFKYYQPQAKGIVIPKSAIKQEYIDRVKATEASKQE